MTISPILKIERQKRDDLEVLQVIYDGVFVCTCKVFSDITKKISHAFVYDIIFSQKEIRECCGAIINNIYHGPEWFQPQMRKFT